jgi:glycosyltransferase involved in cell wall biosynthesis
MSIQRIIALLGRRDHPTDAVEEYCRYLGQGLADHDFALEIRRVPWDEHGWGSSLNALKLQAQSWRGVWILVQYTALAWSMRGFPRRFLSALRILRSAGCRMAIVYHDVEPFGGTRLIDRFRRSQQLRVMRTAQLLADRTILTIPLDRVSWLSADSEDSSFIPVGANLPFPLPQQGHDQLHSPPTVGIFGVTGGLSGDRETRDIVAALRHASQQLRALRLLVFGRNADQCEAELRDGLRDAPVELQVEGVLDDKDLTARFAAMDVLLFARGQISSRRGSAIAGIACGVPVIAVQGDETASPITESGVLLLREEASDEVRQRALGEAVVKVLADQQFRVELVRRNRIVQESDFCWPSIAKRYAEFLRTP